MNDSEQLINKYRPRNLDEVIGHNSVVSSLENIIANRRAHTYLFAGPTGTGKTTLARITAAELGCAPRDINEIDAATQGGVDNLRELITSTKFKQLGQGTTRAILIDECHRLTRPSWDQLLKALEEPRPGIVWLLCTTEIDKVPNVVRQSRAATFILQKVPFKQLINLLDEIAKGEKFTCSNDVVDECADLANGSVRQAIQNLNLCASFKDIGTAREVIKKQEISMDDPKVRDLAQIIIKRGSLVKAMTLAKALSENPEGTRIALVNYLNAVCAGSGDEAQIADITNAMAHFTTPFIHNDAKAMLTIAVARACR